MYRSRPVVEIPSSGGSISSFSIRSRHSESKSNLSSDLPPTRRRTRSSMAFGLDGTQDDGDEISVELKTPSGIGLSDSKNKFDGSRSRASMSSNSTTNDYNGSDYSTPATSAMATPAPLPKQELGSSIRRRGRPVSTLANELPPGASTALRRARMLRDSEFALNPTNIKRKRLSSEEEDEDDEDDSPDAQLARALQEEEDAKSKEMMTGSGDELDELTPRRAKRRTLRVIRPKTDFVAGSSDEDEEDVANDDYDAKTSIKVAVGRRSKEAIYCLLSSDDSEFIASSDEEVPLAVVAEAARIKGLTQGLRTKLDQISREKPSVRKSKYFTSPSSKDLGSGSRRSLSSRFGLKIEESEDSKSAVIASTPNILKEEDSSGLTSIAETLANEEDSELSALSELDAKLYQLLSSDEVDTSDSEEDSDEPLIETRIRRRSVRALRVSTAEYRMVRRAKQDRARLELHHPELLTMWEDLKNLPEIKKTKAEQPANITRELKPFQLEGLNWMQQMELTESGGGLLGDEMGMGKTIQAVSLIMSDYPAKNPSLVLIPPVALMQWQQEMGDYTNGLLKTFVFHGTNLKTKGITVKELKQYDVILMSYNSLESMYRHQEKGFKRKGEVHYEKSVVHQINFHRVILDEAHNIKQRTTNSAKACFALKAGHKWCLSGTPLQNRIGEFFSLIRFLDIRPFACYFCKQCPCSTLEWSMNESNRCTGCNHSGMQHVSVFNQELLNPIQKHGNKGLGKEAFLKLRLLTDRFMLRRVKRDHSAAMELPAKEIYVDRQFFGEEENDFASSIMNNGNRKFETYVAQGVLLNNYANIFGLIMQMRQVADHPDLILKKNGEGGQNILVCCICDEAAEDAIRSSCKHDFCRSCVKDYLRSSDEGETEPDCPRCHVLLSIDLEQPEMEQNEELVKKSSIINRIKMENWTSSTKIEALVHELHKLRSHNSSSKSIIFSGFTTMLQLVEWRLRRAGITTVMLDGSMTPAQRQASINAFMTNPNIECFLVSLKAGGVALNLTEASKVFIVDPWWNPAAEWQSADRCHRIGQCRPCSITRLCIEDSVESRMVLLQEKKTNMIHSTINNDDAAMESLTPEDMQFLFRGT